MGLFPPWNYVTNYGMYHFQQNAGYTSIFSPPTPKAPESAQIDVTRLLIQWVLVAFAVAAIILFLRLRYPVKSEAIVSAKMKEQSNRSSLEKATQQRDDTEEQRFEDRILCEDDACIGILNNKGICGECGRTPAQVRAGKVDMDDLTYSGLPWKKGK
jgi:mannitol-specific phosphotransferase system IIBC component